MTVTCQDLGTSPCNVLISISVATLRNSSSYYSFKSARWMVIWNLRTTSMYILYIFARIWASCLEIARLVPTVIFIRSKSVSESYYHIFAQAREKAVKVRLSSSWRSSRGRDLTKRSGASSFQWSEATYCRPQKASFLPWPFCTSNLKPWFVLNHDLLIFVITHFN